MNIPELRHFLGWDRPAIELVATKLEALNESNPDAFRRATIVVPTAESGRRLREYMAERAKKPLLMPRITLTGQLIPCRGDHVATEQETLAAWLHVLQQAMADKPLPWLLEVATQMQRIRKQLEQEARTPDWQPETMQSFVRDYLCESEEQWENTITYENERWEALKTTFSSVDEQLSLWGLQPAEQCRAKELSAPVLRGPIIIACVPELSPLNRLYLQRLTETGAAQVEIWVNAPQNEAARFDAFGQPIPVITTGAFAKQGWSECPIEIPAQNHGGTIRAEDVIPPTGSVQAFGKKVKELAGGYHARDLILSSCDDTLSPMLVSAFKPEWQVNIPEGRSLLATEAGRIPKQIKDACAAMHPSEPMQRRDIEDVLTLLRNRTFQRCFSAYSVPATFNHYLSELCHEHLPCSVQHLLHIMQRHLQTEEQLEQQNHQRVQTLSTYIRYTTDVANFIQDCYQSEGLSKRLIELSAALTQLLRKPEMKRAARILSGVMRETAKLVSNARIACPPPAALMLMAYTVEKQATGVLEGAGDRNKSINLKGWRELCYTNAPRVIIAGMHEGHVPERMPADDYLPNAYRAFLSMTNDTTRCARDSFLLTALLHSRPAGSIHFVLSAATLDGTPISPSPLLLRCSNAMATAERVNWLFSDAHAASADSEYDLLPFLKPAVPHTNATDMESVALIAEGIKNPYEDTEYTFSPSAIKEFLNCPLRFWLKKIHRISPSDTLPDDKSEPDAAEYGNLLHAILQDITTRYHNTPPTTNCDELTNEIAAYAAECATARVAEQYGGPDTPLPVTLRILQRNLIKTAQAFAKRHATDLCAGWEVILTEERLVFSMPSGQDTAPLCFDMRVDRVDRHRDDGRMRVIDYKSNALDPRKTHWEKLSETASELYHAYLPAEWVVQDSKNNVHRWSSVQLPLYAEALRTIHQLPYLPETGFYNLPRTEPEAVQYHPLSGIDSKSEMTPELHEQAMQCVQTAACLMRSGLCLYSAESLGRSLTYNGFGALSIYKEPDPRVMCSLPPLDLPSSEN